MNDQCSACKYWHENPRVNSVVIATPGKSNGTCLRYPPVTVLLAARGQLTNANMMPSTEEDQLCGEFIAGPCIIPPAKKEEGKLELKRIL